MRNSSIAAFEPVSKSVPSVGVTAVSSQSRVRESNSNGDSVDAEGRPSPAVAGGRGGVRPAARLPAAAAAAAPESLLQRVPLEPPLLRGPHGQPVCPILPHESQRTWWSKLLDRALGEGPEHRHATRFV